MKKSTKYTKTRKTKGMHDFHLWIESWLMDKIKDKCKTEGRTITTQLHRDLMMLYGEQE